MWSKPWIAKWVDELRDGQQKLQTKIGEITDLTMGEQSTVKVEKSLTKVMQDLKPVVEKAMNVHKAACS